MKKGKKKEFDKGALILLIIFCSGIGLLVGWCIGSGLFG